MQDYQLIAIFGNRKYAFFFENLLKNCYELVTLHFCVNCKFDLRALGEGHGDIKINNSGKNAAILWQEER